MPFPSTLKIKTDVGKYIPDDKIDNVLEKLTKRINKILADVRKNLTVFELNKETIDISAEIIKGITIQLPAGTTPAEIVKINKIINDEIMVVEIPLPPMVLDQQCNVYNGGMIAFGSRYIGNWTINNVSAFAQTFTAGATGSLTKLDLQIGADQATGSVTISIQPVDGNGHPTGVILDTVTLDAATEINYNFEFQSLILNGTAHLVQGTKYAIVMDATLVVGEFVGFLCTPSLNHGGDGTDKYVGGEALVKYNEVWSKFYESGIPPAVPGHYDNVMNVDLWNDWLDFTTEQYWDFNFKTYLS